MERVKAGPGIDERVDSQRGPESMDRDGSDRGGTDG